MASITKKIKSYRVRTQHQDFRPGVLTSVTSPQLERATGSDAGASISVKQYHPYFQEVAGILSRCSLLLSSDDSSRNPLFCNGCVYIPQRDELYIASGLLQSSNSSVLPTILISQIHIQRDHTDWQQSIGAVEWMKLRAPQNMPMPAGACLFKEGILYCSQGTLAPDTGGLWYMPWRKAPIPILTNYFGKPFNSIQNVVQDREGGLWFTDASVSFEQGIRPQPRLPNQVYRLDINSHDVRVVADGFGRPTGIALSPDGDTLYVTDTDSLRPDGSTDPTRAATIYAFDVTQRAGSYFLTNRRVFSYAVDGVPMAVTCDVSGNVYAACGDGVEVWSPGGVALGLIDVPGGCTTLCFGRRGELFIGSGQRLWTILLNQTDEEREEGLRD
ncbi:calcium-dependent phosphotriesterase [Hypoxylon sp. FL1284]|nr:calcium-dependent phosphotriesterase [Hypoxylon sp. FL1284]